MLTRTHGDALVSASQVQPGTKDFAKANVFSHAMIPSRSVMSKLKPNKHEMAHYSLPKSAHVFHWIK